MKKIAAAVVALVTVAGLTSASVSSSTAAPDRTTHTKRFVLKEIASHDLGKNAFAGADRVRARASHKVVGFDSYTGRFHPKSGTVTIWVGIALSGGVIDGRVLFTDENSFTGRIVGGSGKYKGVRGTIRGRSADHGRTFVTLRYRL